MKSKSLAELTIATLFTTALVGCEGMAIPKAHGQSTLTLSATYQFRSQGFLSSGQPFFECGFAYFFSDGTKCVESTMHALNQPARSINTCQAGNRGTYSCAGNVCTGTSNDVDSSVMYISSDQAVIEIVGTDGNGTTWQAELHKQ